MEYWTIVLSILAGVLAVCYYLFWRGPNVFQRHGIPHPNQPSLLRDIFRVFVLPKPYIKVVRDLYNMYPDAKYIGIFSFGQPVVMLRDLELIKLVGIKNFDSFEDRLFFGDEVQDPFFGNNLIAMRGDRWRDARALLSPTFTSNKMKTMFLLMMECAVNFSEYLINVPAEKRVMEMKDIFARYANDVIATCAFGIEVDSMRNPKNDFYMTGKKSVTFDTITMVKIVMMQHLPRLSRLLNLKIVDSHSAKFFTNLITETIRTRDEKGITRPDMLQLMMNSRGKRGPDKELTVEDMTSQCYSFFLGGFDTTSTLMSFVAHEIAVNPDVQQRLQDEIDKLLEETNGQPSYEVINGMTYLSAVINEVLRMYTPTPLMDRLCVKDFELPPAVPGAKPYVVKKGSLLWIPFYGLQMDPEYFPEPDKLKPERFLSENRDRCNFDAYHPFGLGPRMCIGNRFALQEIKIVIFHLLARCELKTCDKTPMPLKFKKRGFTVLAEGGFWLSIVPRENRHSTIKGTSPSCRAASQSNGLNLNA